MVCECFFASNFSICFQAFAWNYCFLRTFRRGARSRRVREMATRSVTFACIVSAALSQSCAGDDAPARNHGGSGSFAFAHVYSDHMVLQRAPLAASIWGWGSPGSTINVNLTDATDGSPIQGAAASAQVNVDGTWRALLPPQPASEAPVNVTATDTVSGASIGFGDVLFGDVYVCSGRMSAMSAVGTLCLLCQNSSSFLLFFCLTLRVEHGIQRVGTTHRPRSRGKNC